MADLQASYVCGACGEEIVIPVEIGAGEEQEYVERCPVCCRPHLLRLSVDEDGRVTLQATAE